MHILPSQFLLLSFVASSYCIGFRGRRYPENVVLVTHGKKPPLPSVQNLTMTLIFNFYMVFVTFDGECIYFASVNCLICLSFYKDCDTKAVLSFQCPNPKISLVFFFCVYSAMLILFVSRDDLEEYLEPQEQAQHGDLHGGLQAFPVLGAYFPVLHAARRRSKKAALHRCYFPSFSAMSVTLMRYRINILQILR
ncbi:unnamed protein product, partial [Ixodes pacificus]